MYPESACAATRELLGERRRIRRVSRGALRALVDPELHDRCLSLTLRRGDWPSFCILSVYGPRDHYYTYLDFGLPARLLLTAEGIE